MEIINQNTTDFQAGVIIPVDKPIGWTSFDVVNKLRYLLKFNRSYKKIKVGHAGTLDPQATGVLIVCTGKATKRISELQAETKVYRASMKFGETTPSYDSETEVDKTFPAEHITREMLEQSLQKFVGEITQVPPAFSAVHVNGKRAYELAREGKKPEIKERTVRIDEIKIEKFENPMLDIQVTCHAGTYIRSLVRDIGESVNSGAWMTSLQRTASGDFHVDDCFSLDELKKMI